MNQFMKKFEKGNQHVNVVSAVTKNELTEPNGTSLDYSDYSMAKFIPASGAATRMFKDLHVFMENRKNTSFIDTFFDNLEDFAFYEELTEVINANRLDLNNTEGRVLIIQTLLDKIDYGDLPKALITFHRYKGFLATPIDEHVYEGENYLDPENVNLHFTVAEKHEELFTEYVAGILTKKNHVNITYSFQKQKTDTPAVALNNEPFYLEDGSILYRPGGHGALLENLNDMEEDLIFIKNIDNVSHRSQVEDTIQSKKKLAAIGVEVKGQIDGYIVDLLADNFDLAAIKKFIEKTLNIIVKSEMTKDKALHFLNRPLRVCGVVKNEGEPGGGPYVVDNGDYTDLQICEKAEINLDDGNQAEILNDSEFFNPVDLVCFTKDYKGEKFNLLNYTNEDRYFISEKTHDGRALKALEHPGLWNGAMHHWNTLFVEVPLSTFNPVKNVNDLLKEGHKEKVTIK